MRVKLTYFKNDYDDDEPDKFKNLDPRRAELAGKNYHFAFMNRFLLLYTHTHNYYTKRSGLDVVLASSFCEAPIGVHRAQIEVTRF